MRFYLTPEIQQPSVGLSYRFLNRLTYTVFESNLHILNLAQSPSYSSASVGLGKGIISFYRTPALSSMIYLNVAF